VLKKDAALVAKKPGTDKFKNDPKEPDEKKREKVLSEGEKPLDSADK
jgi:hypothetical protein